MDFSPSRIHARRKHLCFVAALLAGTAITPSVMAQTLPSLLVGAGGFGGSGANGNGGSGGGGGGIGGGGGGSGYADNGGAGGGLYNGVSVGGGGGISQPDGSYAPGTGGAGGSLTTYTNITGGTGGDGSSGAGGGGLGGGGGGGGHGGGGVPGYNETGDGGGGGGAGGGLLGSGGRGGVAMSSGPGFGAGGKGGVTGNLAGEDGANPPVGTSGFSVGLPSAGGGGGGGGGGAGAGAGGNAGYDTDTNSNGPFQAQNGYSGSSNSPVAINYSQPYGIVGVGGGGGGGGGGGQGGDNTDEGGGSGSNGAITIMNGEYLSADVVMIGGDGGGGGGGNAGGTNQGGNGGKGSIIVNGSSASLSVAHALLIGGEGGNAGGSGGQNGGSGGAGGDGTFSIENGGRLVLGNLANVFVPAQLSSTDENGTGLFNISGTANVEVDADNTATVSTSINDLSGGAPAGILTKDGAGRLILAGASDYTGGTTINGGVLQVGTQDVTSAYDAAKTGPLIVSITPADTASSGLAPLQVYGTASLGGALSVNLGPYQSGNSYNIGEKYGIVTATQGVSGNFSSTSVVGPYEPYVKVVTVYGADETDVELLPTPKTVASGHPYGASVYAQNDALFEVLSVPLQADAGYWLHGIGSFGHVTGATYNYKGFIIGRGVNLTPHFLLGGAVSNIYSHTNSGDGSSVDGTSFGAEAYSIYTLPRWKLTGIIGVGHLGNRSTRYLPGIGAGKSANNGTYEGASFRADYTLVDRQHLFISPYATANYLHTHLGRGQETGLDSMNMGFGQVNTSQARLGGGLTGGYKSTTHYGMLTAWAGLGGAGTLGNTHARLDETMGGHAYTYDMPIQTTSVGLFMPSAGVQMVGKTSPWKLAFVWNGQFAHRSGAQDLTLEGSYKF